MHDGTARATTRRAFLRTVAAAGGIALVPGCAGRLVPTASAPPPPPALPPAAAPVRVAARPAVPLGMRPQIFQAAMAAARRHGGALREADRIAIADFALPSSLPRLHLVNLHDGSAVSMLVAHGSGSDPGHTGWLQRFSNVVNSEASSEGAYLASDYYVGRHGRSQRLVGLDPTNDNALSRAIVVHGAWYADQAMVARHGKLGRSQGCFAVADANLATVFDMLGQGRMIYAARG